MPEYLAPGVYVEEVSFRSKSIEGVSTSVAGFIGPTRYGPVAGPPELLTSFADFTRIYGGLDPLQFASINNPQVNFMAHAVRAFFDNGGTKLYVTRTYQPAVEDPNAPPNPDDDPRGKAFFTIGSPATAILRARFAGEGSKIRITVTVRTTANLLVGSAPTGSGVPRTALGVSGVRENDVVFIKHAAGSVAGTGAPQEGLYDVIADGDVNPLAYHSLDSGATVRLADLNPDLYRVHRIIISITVLRPGRFEDELAWNDLSPSLDPNARNAIMKIFTRSPESRLRYLTIPFAIEPQVTLTSGAQLVAILAGTSVLDAVSHNLFTDDELKGLSPVQPRPKPGQFQAVYTLSGSAGDALDGKLPSPEYYEGDDNGTEKTGLKTFEDIDEISIVAAPGYSASYDGAAPPDRANQIVQSLLTHCQIRMRYRVAVLDARDGQVLSEVRADRGQFDSTHAALYYPWITILDPLDPDGQREIELPPSGFVTGIYARSDVLHGVFKAPANEVVLGAINFESLLNKAQQDILNPEGINCFRFFPGRGFRLWGARTISSDPEWKYISVRRYFAYLEHSIDKGTQWAVFENNNEALWANITQTVSDFLFNEWRNGALMGTKPEEAFFVRCDRSTMTQNDLDNGRLVCLIGVAVVKPAEFVIFRIGQMTRKS